MNKKYMLIEVMERDIDGIIYDTFEEAQEAMREAYKEKVEENYDDYDEYDANIGETKAYVNDTREGNWDWKIIEC